MEATAPAHSDRAHDAETEYRSVSGLAVAALVLGLASPAALAAPVLLAVPAAAIGAALLAQRSIRTSDGALTGLPLARIGLALAVASIAAVVVRGPVRDRLLTAQIEPAARQWFAALAEGRDAQAMALLSGQASASLRPPVEPGKSPLPEEDAERIALSKLTSDPVARCLRGMKAPLTVRLLSSAAPVFDRGLARIEADFSVSNGGADPCRIHLQCVRWLHGSNQQPWRIERWSLLGDEPHAH